MKYEWENKAKTEIYPLMVEVEREELGDFKIFGLAVENINTGEACFISPYEGSDSVIVSDLFQDVLGDVEEMYDQTIRNRMKK